MSTWDMLKAHAGWTIANSMDAATRRRDEMNASTRPAEAGRYSTTITTNGTESRVTMKLELVTGMMIAYAM